MLRTHRAGKGSGGCGGRGLGSRNRRGPGVPPTPGLRGQGTSPGSPAGFLGSSGQGKCLPLLSCSSGLESGRAPPTCLESFNCMNFHCNFLTIDKQFYQSIYNLFAYLIVETKNFYKLDFPFLYISDGFIGDGSRNNHILTETDTGLFYLKVM